MDGKEKWMELMGLFKQFDTVYTKATHISCDAMEIQRISHKPLNDRNSMCERDIDRIRELLANIDSCANAIRQIVI